MNKYPGGVGCPYDYVQIYAGNDTTGRSLGKFCGTDAPDPVSSSGSMFIQFVTDRNQAFSGFRAQYRVTGYTILHLLSICENSGNITIKHGKTKHFMRFAIIVFTYVPVVAILRF